MLGREAKGVHGKCSILPFAGLGQLLQQLTLQSVMQL